MACTRMVLYPWLLPVNDVLHNRIRLDAQLFCEVRDGNIHRNEYGSGCRSIWGYAWQSREMGFWMAVTVVVGFLSAAEGLQNGLEKIHKMDDGGAVIADPGACGTQP